MFVSSLVGWFMFIKPAEELGKGVIFARCLVPKMVKNGYKSDFAY
jgi:hypothetical protein